MPMCWRPVASQCRAVPTASRATRRYANPISGTKRIGRRMDQLIAQVAAGLANGAIYACLALALVMIFVSTDHLNFAQGEMAMFSAFLAWQLLEWQIPFWI